MMKESAHDYCNFCIVNIDVSPTLKLHYYRALLEFLLKQKVRLLRRGLLCFFLCEWNLVATTYSSLNVTHPWLTGSLLFKKTNTNFENKESSKYDIHRVRKIFLLGITTKDD